MSRAWAWQEAQSVKNLMDVVLNGPGHDSSARGPTQSMARISHDQTSGFIEHNVQFRDLFFHLNTQTMPRHHMHADENTLGARGCYGPNMFDMMQPFRLGRRRVLEIVPNSTRTQSPKLCNESKASDCPRSQNPRMHKRTKQAEDLKLQRT